MLITKRISKLIADALSITYHSINIAMRVTINPIINITVHNIIMQFYCECTIRLTSFKLRRKHFERWNMVSHHYFCFSTTVTNRFFYKIQTALMLFIELSRS